MNNKQPTQRRGLGRGLGSLIPTAPPEQPGARPDEMGSPAVPSLGRHSAGGVSESDGGGVATLTQERPPSIVDQPREPAQVAGAYFAELPVASIRPNARQPRQVFDEEAM